MFGVTTCNHHQLAGLHHKTSLIVSRLVNTTCLQSKLITGNTREHLGIDGGAGEWIFSRLMWGSLVIGHDGFYMPHLANNVVACVAVFYCSHTNQYMDITWVERSTKKAANNYRTKILGACSKQLIIKAAITRRNILGHGPFTVGCNNMGVMRYGNSPRCPMLEKQPQSDVLRYIKGLMALSRIRGPMQHVYGNADEYLSEAETPA
jgi:hypothetical protein